MTLVMSKKIAEFASGLKRNASVGIQNEAFERLHELDFPTTRDEYWKYTRVGKISNKKWSQGEISQTRLTLEKYILTEKYIVFENDQFRADLSKNDSLSGVKVTVSNLENTSPIDKFDTLTAKEEVFDTINTAFATQTAHIEIEKGASLDQPVQIIFVGNGADIISNNRILIEAAASSKAEVIITIISTDDNAQFQNTVSEIFVAENAQLKVHVVQNANTENVGIMTTHVDQLANSTFHINTLTLEGLLQRNNINIAVSGQNCYTYMNGAIIGGKKQHIDNHTFVDHKVSNCESNENYKYVLDDQSTGVFNGRVIVRQDAQVINAYQNNGNILLSDHAAINSKPELEIYADDVKCSHGSTTGQLDENAIFYLQTRGIKKANAEKLLVAAFIGEVIESFENTIVIEHLYTLLKEEKGWDF